MVNGADDVYVEGKGRMRMVQYRPAGLLRHAPHSRIARSGASRTRRVSPGFLPPRRTRQSPHPGYLDRRHLPARPATPAWLRRSRAQEVDTLADANHERTP